MPSLGFPIAPAGLIVPVWIGLDRQESMKVVAAGRPIPPPLQARGELDTASNITAVSSWMLQQLGLSQKSPASSHTAAGLIPVNLFEVSLSITDLTQAGSPMLTRPSLVVMELTTVLPDADVLIGLDVLLQLKLVVDGPAGKLTLEF
jgi:hypothetical protein